MTPSNAYLAAEIRAARLKVAHIMTQHDLPQLAPIYERLEAECAALDEGDAAMARAAALISNHNPTCTDR